MRQDFRIKVNLSGIFQDARQYSWVFVDSTKIVYVSQLADHIQRLFNLERPFHFLSEWEETSYFLPEEEDVRVLQNNDSIVIVPGTGIYNDISQITVENETLSSSKMTNGFVHPVKRKSAMVNSQKSASEKSSETGECSIQNISDIASTSDMTCYRTALYETAVNDTKDSKISDLFTEDASIFEESNVSNKRKRVRKRKSKKSADAVTEESDISTSESADKKPKILESVVLSSGKHIRFKGIDNDESSDTNISAEKNDIQRVNYNGHKINNKQFVNKDLTALLNLRQSSTPLTFSHKKSKREIKTEAVEEDSIVSPEIVNKTNDKDNSNINKSTVEDDTYSFKVFRMGEDYTPQLSSVIIGKMLSCSSEDAQCTIKILHGKDQLKDPEGKFSLPKEDEENQDDDDNNDIIIIEKDKLLELTKVKPIGTPV